MRATARRWPPEPSEEESFAVAETLYERSYTDGPQTRALELDLADYIGVERAVAFQSCTAALHALLSAIRPPVLYAPAWTFVGSLTGAAHLGIEIRLLDVDPDSHMLEELPPDGLALAVDLHGATHPLPRDRVLTDSCQALGTDPPVGMGGHHAWSFSGTKAVPSFSGGAITTDDDGLADELLRLRNYGIEGEQRGTSQPSQYGHHWRITEPDAALARLRLGTFNRVGGWRDKMVSYGELLREAAAAGGLEVQLSRLGGEVAWQKIRVRVPGLPHDVLERELDRYEIPWHRWGYPLWRVFGGQELPVTQALWLESVCLGTEEVPFWTWTGEELGEVCVALTQVRAFL